MNPAAPTSPEDANTVDREEVVPDNAPVIPNPDGNVSGGEGQAAVPARDPMVRARVRGTRAGGPILPWGGLQALPPAYGGSSDPYTPNPGITATGAVCDDWSMGVAVPMSLPNYRSYFRPHGGDIVRRHDGVRGRQRLRVHGGGSRVLDLQPGVFKAFGFGDCYAWGLRTVNYRFL